jgi:glutamate dehydrogenase (NAD(P)+)
LIDKELAAKVVAVSDVSGGLYNAKGLNLDKISRFVSRGKELKDYKSDRTTHISNEELLELEVDLLIPAALENQINANNADNIKAGVIVEGANGPTTVEADAILNKKGTVIVPDILANAGGVIVSYFEWAQNLQSLFWDEDKVNRQLDRIMVTAIDEVFNLAAAKKVSMRTSAYALALQKLVHAKNLRGIFP